MKNTTNFLAYLVNASQRLGQLGDEHELSQTWIVEHKTATLDPIIHAELMIDEGVIPVVNELYSVTGLSGYSWQQFARFRNYSMTPDQNKKWRLELRWSTLYTTNPTSTTTLKYSLPSNTEYNTVARSTTIYRTSWTVNPPAALDASADIGGTPISGNTSGTAIMVPQTRVRMRFAQDASAASMISQATRLANYVDKMNSASFLGCAARTLVCEGLNMVPRTGEYYDVIFDFLYDPWYHHEQVATVEADGRPGRAGADVAEVKWKRIVRSVTDFNNLYGTPTDADLKTMTEKGWWV